MEARFQREIQHGRYLVRHGAGEIWNWESPAGRIRWERRVRMLTRHIHPEMDVLELGCGTAYFTRELALTRARITAIDISPDLLAAARQQCRAHNVRFEIQNACALAYPDASFDSIVGSSVLHHLVIDQALTQIYRVLRPGGTIRFTEPNMLNPQTRFRDIRVTPFDFLHPKIPTRFIPSVKAVGDFLEKAPLISEIAGSLYIEAAK